MLDLERGIEEGKKSPEDILSSVLVSYIKGEVLVALLDQDYQGLLDSNEIKNRVGDFVNKGDQFDDKIISDFALGLARDFIFNMGIELNSDAIKRYLVKSGFDKIEDEYSKMEVFPFYFNTVIEAIVSDELDKVNSDPDSYNLSLIIGTTEATFKPEVRIDNENDFFVFGESKVKEGGKIVTKKSILDFMSDDLAHDDVGDDQKISEISKNIMSAFFEKFGQEAYDISRLAELDIQGFSSEVITNKLSAWKEENAIRI